MSDISRLVIYLKEILFGCKFADGINMVKYMEYIVALEIRLWADIIK